MSLIVKGNFIVHGDYVEHKTVTLHDNSQYVNGVAPAVEDNGDDEPQVAGVGANGMEVLRGCFKMAFVRKNQMGVSSFDDCLVPDLGKEWKDKQWGTIALMIYESNMLSVKPASFAEWYRQFCEIVGCSFRPSYRPTLLQPDAEMKKTLYYLDSSYKAI